MNSINERGAMLLLSGDGEMVAWIPLNAEGEWREISWIKSNSPTLSVRHIVASKGQLSVFIQDNYLGWTVRKLNLPGICVDDENIIVPPEDSTCPSITRKF